MAAGMLRMACPDAESFLERNDVQIQCWLLLLAVVLQLT
jgi:hypothetical protein